MADPAKRGVLAWSRWPAAVRTPKAPAARPRPAPRFARAWRMKVLERKGEGSLSAYSDRTYSAAGGGSPGAAMRRASARPARQARQARAER